MRRRTAISSERDAYFYRHLSSISIGLPDNTSAEIEILTTYEYGDHYHHCSTITTTTTTARITDTARMHNIRNGRLQLTTRRVSQNPPDPPRRNPPSHQRNGARATASAAVHTTSMKTCIRRPATTTSLFRSCTTRHGSRLYCARASRFATRRSLSAGVRTCFDSY